MINNGYISSDNFEGFPGEVDLGENEQFPYKQFIYTNSQKYGVFAFYFEQDDLPLGYAHLIKGNTFSHIFCE